MNKMEDIRKFINLVESAGITDNWFDTDSFKAYKKPSLEKYEVAKHPGELDHLEGNGKTQHYQRGWYIITGPKGERYSMPPEKFQELKIDNGNGTAIPKPIMKLAKLADHNGVVNTSWGQPLHYNAGKDYIVKHGPGDYGVVKTDIFKITYDLAK